jgi:long-chain acyl-CoA synthetase
VRKIIDDAAELKPTFFAGVPRVFDRVYDKITNMVAASNPITKFLFNKALAASEESIKTGIHYLFLYLFFCFLYFNILNTSRKTCVAYLGYAGTP